MIEKVNETENKRQKLVLEDRRLLCLSGVKEVEAFSDREVVLNTNLGKLSVKGEGLKINKLNVDTGDFSVNGHVVSMTYSKASQNSGSFFEKLFR